MDAVTFIEQYSNFSPNSRLWVYQADRILSEDEVKAIQENLTVFTAQWQAHGSALKAVGQVLHQSLIILMVDERVEPASGCSIDSSVHFIKSIQEKFACNFFDRTKVLYLDEANKVQLANTSDKDLLKGKTVCNTAVNSFAAFKEHFLIPYEQSAFANLNSDSSFSLQL